MIESRTGSRFWLCARSRSDPAFARYPQLPVLACHGYAPMYTAASGEARGADDHEDVDPLTEERTDD